MKHDMRDALNIADAKQRRIVTALNAAKIGVFEFEPITQLAFWDDRVRELWNVPPGEEITYETVIAQVHPDDRDYHNAATRAVLDPDGSGHMDIEYRLLPRGGKPMRWIRATADCRFEDGVAQRLVGTVQDVTDRREIQDRNEFLLDELEHRLKNTMSLVSALISLSRPGHDSVDAYIRTLTERVSALANSHEMLYRSDWSDIEIRALLRKSFTDLLGSDARLIFPPGPDFIVPKKSVFTMSLAIHELASNALKYGALSVETGTVHISVTGEGAGQKLRWEERGGPAIPACEFATSGFGSFLLRRVLAYEMDARVSYRSDGAGAVFEMDRHARP